MKIISIARGIAAVACLTAGVVACRPTTQPPADPNLPIIFVHGFMGSGSQYRSQQLRFASNGFDRNRIKVFNYNTATVDTSRLNGFVDAVRQELGVSKVNLVGHSLGTGVVTGYVAANAAKVGRFVLVDGVGCPAGNANCLAIRAAEMGQTHVEANVSAESFDRQYRFFTGRAPTTTAIVPEAPEQVKIAGYALNLQTNLPNAGAAAQVWELDGTTGARVGASPRATFTVAADGSWGPVSVDGRRHYEITASMGASIAAHYYFQPFTRSSDFVHLIGSPPDGPSAANTNRGPNHVALVVQRQRELWRSHGARNDNLQVGVGSQMVNAFQNVPGDVVAAHIHDDRATPGTSSLGLLNYFRSQPFQTGVDVYLPAATPPSGTVTVTNAFRGDSSRIQRIAVPNWASATNHVIIELDDWAS